jgi:hypothetical protein
VDGFWAVSAVMGVEWNGERQTRGVAEQVVAVASALRFVAAAGSIGANGFACGRWSPGFAKWTMETVRSEFVPYTRLGVCLNGISGLRGDWRRFG